MRMREMEREKERGRGTYAGMDIARDIGITTA